MPDSPERPADPPSRNERHGAWAALSGLADPHGAVMRRMTDRNPQPRPEARDEKAQTVSAANSARQSTGSRIANGPVQGEVTKS